MPLLEDALLSQCKQFLTYEQNKGNLIFKRIHVMPIIRAWRFRPCCKTNMPMLSPNEDMIGMPDLLIWMKKGPVLSVELKSPKGKLKSEQIEYKEAMEKMGHSYHIVRDVDELIKLVTGSIDKAAHSS